MSDGLGVDLEDAELHEEIELMGSLMAAARTAVEPLSQALVDDILRDPTAVMST
jgi:hypothetical protein